MARTRPEARRGRSLLERLAMLFPGLVPALGRAIFGLPRSRLRTALIDYAYRRTYAAYGRGDWELNTAAIDRDDYVFRMAGDPPVPDPGLLEGYCGVEGYLYVVHAWLDAWSDAEMIFEGSVEIDRDRSAALLRVAVRGSGSGVAFDQPVLDVHELRGGTVRRQTLWWEREEGLRALGVVVSA